MCIASISKQREQYFAAILCVVLYLAASHAQAANTIDPNSTGATDIFTFSGNTPIMLTNPLSDPLDLGSLYVGDTTAGELLIDNGSSVLSNFGGLGFELGSLGRVTVDGVGSTWWTSDQLFVGGYGEGILSIVGGGEVSSGLNSSVGAGAGSSGQVTVDGAGSTWDSGGEIYVGWGGEGSLAITGGGVVRTDGGSIGDQIGSIGQVTVAGAGSMWTYDNVQNNLSVGKSGQGALGITNGGTVENRDGIIGEEPGSTGQVTVDGAGLTWTNYGSLYIGSQGNGELSIANGAVVSSTGSLYVGSQGSGVLNIGDGASVHVSGPTFVSYLSSSQDEINFIGGTLTTDGLFAAAEEIYGIGTINSRGAISGVDLIFDATHGLSQTLTLNSLPGQDITINLDVDGSGWLGASDNSMSVAEGMSVSSMEGYIGIPTDSSSQVTIDGVGSTWTNSNRLSVD